MISRREELAKSRLSKPVSFARNSSILCSHCGKQFTTQTLLKKHMANHRPRSFPCKVCGAKFRFNYHLMRHVRVHQPIALRKEKCDKCGKLVSKLKLHLMKMHGEGDESGKKFVCRYCPASFWDTNRLKTHERVHTKEKPYQCSKCERSFASANYLRLHAYLHTGERKYACKFCGKCFGRGSNRDIHEKHVHMKEFYSCPKECGRQFRRKNKAMEHGEECHGVALSRGFGHEPIY